MRQLLSLRELGLKEALERQRKKNLVQMEEKLQELNGKVASWTETLSRVRVGLERKDNIGFLKVRGKGQILAGGGLGGDREGWRGAELGQSQPGVRIGLCKGQGRKSWGMGASRDGSMGVDRTEREQRWGPKLGRGRKQGSC